MRWTSLYLLAAVSLVRGEVSFNRDIRPIMADTCFRCHGPDKNARMMGLRLDIRDEALKKTASGVTPILPGDPDHSAIIQRIFASDRKIMPPAAAHKELTAVQKATIPRVGRRRSQIRRTLGVPTGVARSRTRRRQPDRLFPQRPIR
jgi:hypothetical protein